MISVEEAEFLVYSNIVTNKATTINLVDSVGYYLSKTVYSPIDMPPFRQSAMDGYAICFHDAKTYNIKDEVKAGDGHHPKLKAGEAVRIFTGAAVPDTANAVIMQEKVSVNNGKLTIEETAINEQNIRPLGEQAKKGALALYEGVKLTPAAIGFLTSLGITKVEVFRMPSVAIVTTGNELVEAGKSLPYGKIYESNSNMLRSALINLGHNKISIYKVEDDYNKTLNTLQNLVSTYDLVIVSGGISVGDYDFVGKALQELEVETIFYKVKQKPGKPLFFGKRNNSIVFALPGNPAAALSCFYLYVYPALELISGNLKFKLNKCKAKLDTTFVKKGDRAQFLKAILIDNHVKILEGQSSAMLQTFALANALVFMPEDINVIHEGEDVEVIQLPN